MKTGPLASLLLILAGFLFCTTINPARAQGFQGDSIMTIPGRPGVYRLIGHVKIVHNGNTIYSNYADYEQKTGSCQAYGALRIITKDKVRITGEILDYNGQTGSYLVDRNVVLNNGQMELKTPSLRFEGRTNVAYYENGGEMTSGETVMTSKRGYQEGNKNLFHCFEDVVIVNPDYTIWTDTLHYSQTEVTRFQGPTNIETTDYYMFGNKGWFNQQENKVSLQRDAYVKNKKSQVLYGDSIYYELDLENGQAFGDVFLLDTARSCYIKSQYAHNNESTGEAMFTLEPHGLMVEEGDTLFFAADTLIMTYDTAHSAKEIFAYRDVRLFREDMQGVCDSLVYKHRDSTMYLYRVVWDVAEKTPSAATLVSGSDTAETSGQGKPMVWVQEYQIDGDTIILYLENSKPKRTLVRNNVFIVSEVSGTQGYYNQVKGKLMWGYFDSASHFEMAHVITAAQSIYYVLDDKNELMGINKTESQSFKMYFRNNQVHGVSVLEPVSSVLYKLRDLTQRQRLLRGFHYEPWRRPVDKYSLSDTW